MQQCRAIVLWFLAILSCATAHSATAVTLPVFDFSQPDVVRQWHAQHHIARLESTAEGLAVDLSGADPYFAGPARDFPTNTSLWIVLRLKAPRAGDGQIFYFRPGTTPTEEMSAHFGVRGGNEWEEVRVPLPSLDHVMHLRLDPPGDHGRVVMASLRFEKRVALPPPQWPAWIPPSARPDTVLASGDIELRPGATNPDGIEIRVAGQRMAFGHPRSRLAYLANDAVQWVELPQAAAESRRADGVWRSWVRFTDPHGANWRMERIFAPESPGAVRVETKVVVDRDR